MDCGAIASEIVLIVIRLFFIARLFICSGYPYQIIRMPGMLQLFPGSKVLCPDCPGCSYQNI